MKKRTQDRETVLAADQTGELIVEGVPGLTRILGQNFDLTPAAEPNRAPTAPQRASEPLWLKAYQASQSYEQLAAEAKLEGLSILSLQQAFTAVRGRLVRADFEDFTLESIIRDADVSEGEADALRGHFKDAIELTNELLLRYWYSALFADLSKAAVDGASVADRITALGLRHMERARQDPELGKAVADLLFRTELRARAPRDLLARLDTFNTRATKTIAGLIAEGQMLNQIREGDPAQLAMVTFTSYFGFVSLLGNPQILVSKGIYLDEMARRVVEVTVDGLKI